MLVACVFVQAEARGAVVVAPAVAVANVVKMAAA
jgi:hypothetical protein